MAELKATAVAHPNIAFIKYWGNYHHELRLPANGSISMTLADLSSKTTVIFDPQLERDTFQFNDRPSSEIALIRVSKQLDLIRQLAEIDYSARVISQNNFPESAGIASSASGFAALTLAASQAAGLDLDKRELSRIARRASGSACRSIFGGFVEWFAATSNEGSYAISIAPAEHWPLIDLVAVVDDTEKDVGSSEGHRVADSSPLQKARVQSAPDRLARVKRSIQTRDFIELAETAELDSNMMHAVMMTSSPPLHYWQPATISVMHQVHQLRRQGIPVFYTLDAGPNPHCICPEVHSETVLESLKTIQGIKNLLRSEVGGPAKLVPDSPTG